MNLATELQSLVASSGAPVEFTQGSYRLRVMPGVGRIPDVTFSIWEAEDVAQWEPILTGWARGERLIVATWQAPGSPDNVESLLRVILAGKRLVPESIYQRIDARQRDQRRVAAAS